MSNNNTAIEWTHRPGTAGETWNPVIAWRWVTDEKTGERTRLRGWHCEHATTGCINCYSERQNLSGARGGTKLPYKPGHRHDVEIELHEKTLLRPLTWKQPRTIFVCSMTDLYGDWVTDEMLDRIKAVQALTPQHTYIELTKRAERMRGYCLAPRGDLRAIAGETLVDTGALTPQQYADRAHLYRDEDDGRVWYSCFSTWPLRNVWAGVSCERQQEADERIPLLLQTPAAVRFISAEPLLGPISLRWAKWDDWKGPDGQQRRVVDELDGARLLDWIIVGGESGKDARPMHPDWARSLRDQCAAAGVSFFYKQWGEWAPHRPMAGGDLGGDVRAGLVRIVHPSGKSDVEISAATGGHNTEKGSRYMARVGKKAAGRLLDGREHGEFPNVAREA